MMEVLVNVVGVVAIVLAALTLILLAFVIGKMGAVSRPAIPPEKTLEKDQSVVDREPGDGIKTRWPQGSIDCETCGERAVIKVDGVMTCLNCTGMGWIPIIGKNGE